MVLQVGRAAHGRAAQSALRRFPVTLAGNPPKAGAIMSQPNRVLAVKHRRAVAERREAAHTEFTKSPYLTPKAREWEYSLPEADYIDDVRVKRFPTGKRSVRRYPTK